ncbi:hypothetical protein GSH05_28460 [Burkholderia pseudomallei]|nr:hypothetical protein [Burkholderia pseudomallei]
MHYRQAIFGDRIPCVHGAPRNFTKQNTPENRAKRLRPSMRGSTTPSAHATRHRPRFAPHRNRARIVKNMAAWRHAAAPT